MIKQSPLRDSVRARKSKPLSWADKLKNQVFGRPRFLTFLPSPNKFPRHSPVFGKGLFEFDFEAHLAVEHLFGNPQNLFDTGNVDK